MSNILSLFKPRTIPELLDEFEQEMIKLYGEEGWKKKQKQDAERIARRKAKKK